MIFFFFFKVIVCVNDTTVSLEMSRFQTGQYGFTIAIEFYFMAMHTHARTHTHAHTERQT